jgi:hypothetical protein
MDFGLLLACLPFVAIRTTYVSRAHGGKAEQPNNEDCEHRQRRFVRRSGSAHNVVSAHPAYWSE